MEDLQKAWDKCIFIADSFHELDLLDELAKNHGEILEIGIRVNPNYSMTDKKAHQVNLELMKIKFFFRLDLQKFKTCRSSRSRSKPNS